MGVCRPSLQILTLFQTPKDIPYTLLLAGERSTYLHFGWGCAAQAFKSSPISDPKSNSYTLFQTKLQKSMLHSRPDKIRITLFCLSFVLKFAKLPSTTEMPEQIEKNVYCQCLWILCESYFFQTSQAKCIPFSRANWK